ncbi:DNA methylase N-4/N-6 domain protein [Anaeromyxobacter dehalogenans 2CP-1]|uniref:Methyltransferase n=1 Tax=Anaeromyxobacter dehalogenans (strain ATCC BAA-258 / DSM 21875 / 2CP-1) TaxID=455488 RepID=B8JFJ4_ANAD2|nr:site-specific DNA-methyltransferase [Anaeromyxobacter dehalogenans]ACL66371.1 DNA methylase N-4/N-6 domain protein [Anaeromyxobacter dehalogenans 2CP-1]
MATRLELLHEWNDLPGVAERGRGWALVQGDCVEALERLPPHSVDVAFADPPYMLSNGGSTCQGGRRTSVNKGSWDASGGFAADHAFQARWLQAVRKVLKPSGTLWVSGTQHVIFSIGYAMQELGFHLLNTVTWYKPNASPNLACRFFTHSTEILLWASPMKARPLAHRFNYRAMKTANGGKQMRDLWEIADRPAPGGDQVVWSVPTPGPREKVHGRHPTQKPLALLERVLAASAAPGDLVLDPFSGSATTGVAALRAGCRFLGLERDPGYVDLAARRLRATTIDPE